MANQGDQSNQSNQGYDHQDWKEIVFKKRTPNPEIVKSSHGHTTENVQKFNAGKNKQTMNVNAAKLERKLEEEDFKFDSYDRELRIQIQQKRLENKWSQKDLATKCDLPESAIKDIEAGRGIPNKQNISKVKRILGITKKK